MSKTIESFRETTEALFIDLIDSFASVTVDTDTGDMLLFEGAGNDRFHGMLIAPGFFRGFALNLTEADDWEVLLRFGEGKSHSLGVTTSAEEATRWLRKAAEIIRAKQADSPKPELEAAELVVA
ncbi:MAG: hypothetical protein ACKVY0_00090 [Prosthecobacter sp.]|uniref:hypothetical protein n=1 Tax=Prosthecobacter sp. TaxID=1965333 RepID=UPI0038FF9DAE